MTKNSKFPYSYEFPLPEVKGAPVPSQANYEPKNVAWVIEMFSSILGKSKESITLRYENNTPKNKSDDILVQHPNDKIYYDKAIRSGNRGSAEMDRYNIAAKRSKRLLDYMNTSPANITYFSNHK